MATVVVELGDSLIRVGLAGESAPRFISPASTYPISGKTPGEIRQQFTEIFHAFFIENLQIKSKEHRVLVIEKFFTPSSEGFHSWGEISPCNFLNSSIQFYNKV